MSLELNLYRKKNDGNTTIGALEHKFISGLHTLEDEPREVKVKGETRIKAGRYEIKEREELSGLTKKYRAKYPWFKWHLQLQNLENFNYVYIHILNNEKQTDGCIGVGYQTGNWTIWESTEAMEHLYYFITGALHAGTRVFINIIDQDGE